MKNKLELIRCYHQGYTTEILWVQAYRVLFLMAETLLFASAFGLSQVFSPVQINLWYMRAPLSLISILGMTVTIFWIRICEKRSNRAEDWRKEICNLSDEDLSPDEKRFRNLCLLKPVAKFGRRFFNWALPIFLFFVWAIVLLFV
jgi:hypothetical protein